MPQFVLYSDSGKINRNYDKTIQEILEHFKVNPAQPVTLKFSNGLDIKAQSFVGSGGRNVIFDIGDNKIIRLRTKRHRIFSINAIFNPLADKTVLSDSLYDYLAGYKTLEEQKVPLPALFNKHDHTNEFLILEKLNILFDYIDYLGAAQKSAISGISLEQIDTDFLRFAEQTASFRNIGDFRGDQLVYTAQKGWVLLDFSEDSILALPEGDGNIFEKDAKDQALNYSIQNYNEIKPLIFKPGLPKWIREKALQRIQIARNNNTKTKVKSCPDLLNN
jgi:hypothetical protein